MWFDKRASAAPTPNERVQIGVEQPPNPHLATFGAATISERRFSRRLRGGGGEGAGVELGGLEAGLLEVGPAEARRRPEALEDGVDLIAEAVAQTEVVAAPVLAGREAGGGHTTL